jgi:predicted Zn-ribbon and HTH transcriptional regulator
MVVLTEEIIKRDELKAKAYYELYKALLNGDIKRQKVCSLCGSTHRISAHHPDYTKPLDVEWLCSSCHISVRHSPKKNPNQLLVIKQDNDKYEEPKLVKIFKCRRCGHVWASSMVHPNVCPNQKCHSLRWSDK